MGSIPIAHYWAWDLEKLRYFGLLSQVLGLFFFLSLWWHGDRAWRILRWFFVAYLSVIGLARYALWLGYGIYSRSPTEVMQRFMVRSGSAGFSICIALIIFLIVDSFRKQSIFNQFGPENWNRVKPAPIQVAGLVVAILCIWSPLVPHPVRNYMSLFTFGFPTAFGVNLPPTLLFMAGLATAGSRKSLSDLAVWFGFGAALSALLSEPLSIHGIVIILAGLWFAVVSLVNRRKQN
jgi:hypothetical protein